MQNSSPDFGLHSTRILTESGFQNATLLIKEGKISEIVPGKTDGAGFPVEEAGDMIVMPGIIDSHVHINEPGRTEWEGFDTITKAAIAGGITTLVDMPLNSSPVTISRHAFQEKLLATNRQLHCNCGFWGGVVPTNIEQLEGLMEAGVLGIKAFLTHSGIDEFPNVTASDLKKAMPLIAKHRIPLLAHAELEQPNPDIEALERNPKSYKAFLNSRPKSWEDKAVELMIGLCEELNCPVHIVHLSSANSIDQIKKAKAKGLPLTVETCPHYLYFCSEEIPDANTLFKCAPPIRERENNEKLWEALKDGTIDFVVTDHSPASPELKKLDTGNLKEAWGGIASVQFSMPVIWTAAKARGLEIRDIADLMSSRVARFIGFEDSKGLIKKGFDADLVVWDPDEKFTVEKGDIYYRHKISPYVGEELYGVVKQTYVNGEKVFENGNFTALNKGNVLLKN